jgi:superfamily II DNA or RNA helicase
MLEIKLLNNKHAQLTGDVNVLTDIRECFSVPNPAFGRGNKFAAKRLYVITPSGRFDIGLTKDICDFLHQNGTKFLVSHELNKKINVGFEDYVIKTYEKLTYRDHQDISIKAAMKNGRGVIIIPTAGGKTLIMAGIIESMRKNLNDPNALAMVLVPTIQLVEQTANDFINYGVENVTKWSGDNKPNLDATTIVAGNQILLSENTDLSILSNVKILLMDETHTLKHKNKINKIFDLLNTDFRFGFTGTMPSCLIDQWNIIGKIGPVLYEKKTIDLKEKKYVSNFKITILSVLHSNLPNFNINATQPADRYNNEIEYLINDSRRNEIIAKLSNRLTNNTIIMVDRIDHGVNLQNILKTICPEDKPIYFIQGSTEMEERERIRKLMEERNDVIAVAVSKIFSTGINIPNLHNIIFASAGKAKIKIMQSIGRALRLHPTKTMANIFDISDNTKYGKVHVAERIKLYTQEKYTYEQKTIQK